MRVRSVPSKQMAIQSLGAPGAPGGLGLPIGRFLPPTRLRVRCFLLLAIAALLGQLPIHAQEIGTLTLLKDTPLHVIRGVSMLQGVEGMRLHAGDMLETGPAPGAQAQLEFTGGAIVELGPSTQVLVSSASAASGEIFLAAGWLKGETTAGVYRYLSPLAGAISKGGNVLLHATGDAAEVFVERGNASVGGGGLPVASAPGKIFFSRKGGKPLVPADRPSGDFIGAMPICFRDLLPPRLPAFEGKKTPAPKTDHEVTYADVERWVTLPAYRKAFAARFRSRLQDPAFRQAIEAHQSSLPEWAPYLHPDNAKPTSPPGD